MKALLQRVTRARVDVDGETVGAIGAGLLVFVGVEPADQADDARQLAERTLTLRIFPDADKPMNVSVQDVAGDLLVVSQFTLAADTRRGRRPGFTTAAPPAIAEPLFDTFVATCRAQISGGGAVATGVFGADMQVHLVNDGPVTLLLESRRD